MITIYNKTNCNLRYNSSDKASAAINRKSFSLVFEESAVKLLSKDGQIKSCQFAFDEESMQWYIVVYKVSRPDFFNFTSYFKNKAGQIKLMVRSKGLVNSIFRTLDINEGKINCIISGTEVEISPGTKAFPIIIPKYKKDVPELPAKPEPKEKARATKQSGEEMYVPIAYLED